MARRSSSKATRILPPEIAQKLQYRFIQFLGGSIIVMGILVLLSLATFSSLDESWNTSSALMTTHNLLGSFGAVTADLLLQSFGLGSFLCVLAFIVWGGIVIVEGGIRRPYLKLSLLMISIILCSTALTAAPKVSWFFDLPHLGGVLGVIGVTLIGKIAGFKSITPIQITSAALCGVFYAAALGLSLYQWGVIGSYIRHKGAGVHQVSRTGLSGLIHRLLARQSQAQDVVDEPVLDRPVLRADIDDRVQLSASPETQIPIKSSIYDESDYSDETIESYEDSLIQEKPVFKPQAITQRQSGNNLEDYQLPTLDLLDVQIKKAGKKGLSDDQLQAYAVQLEQVLGEFGVKGEIVGVCPGPVVTLYELKPAAGIKTSRVIGLADDIARSMSAHSARIAVIPGRNVIGIEMPNPVREMVYMRDLLLADDYQKHSASLAMILGKDIGGNPIIADLARMPHLLVAGTTGSGKSVSVNTMILSLLFRLTPDQCKFIMIDPKMLEFSIYDGIPHLLTPVVTDPKKAVVALKWAVREMENRYRAMSKLGVRNIDGYNERIKEARQSGEILMRRVQTGFDPDTGKPIFENQSLDVTPLPYIVVVVDEMADLMLVAGKDIETAVQRLAQMARAAGIHLIMATQRPSVDVITGTIKANFPTRISFMVTSKIDSRTILGEQGAEQLLGQGDMLYMAGGGRIVRVHGPFVKDTEVERIVQFLKAQGEPAYIESVTEDDGEFSAPSDGADGGDAMYQQAVDLVRREGKASTSFIQRHLQIGYNRAARIVDQMEKEGLISSANHVGKREVIG